MFYKKLKLIIISSNLFLLNQAMGEVSLETQARQFAKFYTKPTKIPFPAANPYSKAKSELGKALFFEQRISGAGMTSCATCHIPTLGWQEGLPISSAPVPQTSNRKTQTLYNLAYSKAPMNWDGKATSLEDQAVKGIPSPKRMDSKSMDNVIKKLSTMGGYKKMFKDAFGSEEITTERIGQAIATFERTIVSTKAPFDYWVEGKKSAMNESAKRGFIIFNTKGNCSSCHSGFRFTDDSFQNIGVKSDDKGRGGLKEFEDVDGVQYAFKTSTLRNIALRAPYMHNGQEKTLEDVVEFYNRGGDVKRENLAVQLKPLGLSKQEVTDLVEFMHALTSKDPAFVFPEFPLVNQ